MSGAGRGPRAREDHLDRRRVPLGQALPIPGGHLAGRGHRPRGGHPGQGPELARGRRAARGGGHAGGLRPLLELVPPHLLPDPRGPRGRDRPQGADRPPDGRQLLRDPAQARPTPSSPSPSSAPGSRARRRSARTGSRRCSRAGSRRSTEPMPAVPDSARHLVIGAGVHGLSTAWHLAAGRRGGAGASTRPGSAPGPRGSPAGWSATTTSSRRCRS